MGLESRWLVDRSQATSTGGMVAAKTLEAARAGADVLKNGGNAIDAAVVTAMVAGVVEQWMNGIGGGGYLVRHDPRSGETDVVAYPMISPASAKADMFPLSGLGADTALFGWPSVVDNANIVGHRAVGVPGTVDGLAKALARWGSISWAAALEPAIDIAESGFPITWHSSARIASDLQNLRRFPATAELYCPDGLPVWSYPGSPLKTLRQPDLAASLRALASNGHRELYEGELAARIIQHLNAGGAQFSASDFSRYEAEIETALLTSFHGNTIATPGNSTGGTTLTQSLRLLEKSQVGQHETCSPESLHLQAQAYAIAFADRFAYLADPRLVDVPLDALLSDDYITTRAAELTDGPAPPPRAGSRSELGVTHALASSMPDYASGGSTTHLSVIDRDGVTVSLTQTLLSAWGSRVVVPSTGILMNNAMMWFDPEPGRPNSIAGGKRPLSNMAPAVLIGSDGSSAAIGASGGRRIMNCNAQIAMHLIDDGMSMQQAVSTPRIDRSTPALIVSSRFPESTVESLRRLGHVVEQREESHMFSEFASPACVRFDGQEFTGGVDPWYYPATATGV